MQFIFVLEQILNGLLVGAYYLLIALGLSRYGLKRPVAQITRGLFEAATYMDLRRLPELFCGFQRERRRGPTLYPVACAPQAWASATVFSLGSPPKPPQGNQQQKLPRHQRQKHLPPKGCSIYS